MSTFAWVAMAALGILVVMFVVDILAGTIWESEEERRRELSELRRSIGQDAGKGD